MKPGRFKSRPGPVKKIFLKGQDENCPVPFFIPSRFSYRQPLRRHYENKKRKNWKIRVRYLFFQNYLSNSLKKLYSFSKQQHAQNVTRADMRIRTSQKHQIDYLILPPLELLVESCEMHVNLKLRFTS